MRFRRKLSIVFVALTVLPLVAAALLVQFLLIDQHTTRVDGRLQSQLAAAAADYKASAELAQTRARFLARQLEIQRAFTTRDRRVLLDQPPLPDGRMRVALSDSAGLIAGVPPTEPSLRAIVTLLGEDDRRRVTVWMPLGDRLATRLDQVGPDYPNVDISIVSEDEVVASTGDLRGPAGDVLVEPAATTLGGTAVRALGFGPLPVDDGRQGWLVASYPQALLDEEREGLTLRVLVPTLALALLLGVLALVAADRISRALSELSGRALALVRGEIGGAAAVDADEEGGGDELAELNSALNTMSSELSSRMTQLEDERERLKQALTRYGDTLASTHDLRGLLGAVLDTAVQATRARGGRLLLCESDGPEATEQVRLGTARGSRTDLPMIVMPGAGIEGQALASGDAAAAESPRAVLVVPIRREHEVLGLVTVVDPEAGRFASDAVETLTALVGQAAVAIENARLHRVVEQQAISDALTGLANRRQFYEVLGREYERAQRFGQAVSLIVLDVDNFKGLNDTHGHLAGDAVLRGVADILAGNLREIDLAARYGGEEFAIVLPQTGLSGAVLLAERLRAAVAENPMSYGDEVIGTVTASFGVATGPDEGGTQVDLIGAADEALYAAKREGKNCVVAAPVPAAADGGTRR